jgi:sugar/nucleoside kinase (ribokinase family)
VGTLEQIVNDIVTLADSGAVEVVLDPNPDPRPRDFAAEQRQLLEITDAFKQREREQPSISGGNRCQVDHDALLVDAVEEAVERSALRAHTVDGRQPTLHPGPHLAA